MKELVGLGDSADVEVRLAVAHGLAWRMEGVETLVLLTRDVDYTVRDWATFGLGEMAEADSEEVRGGGAAGAVGGG